MYKKCVNCKNEYALSSFGKDVNRKDGRNVYCKECVNSKAKESYRRYKTHHYELVKRWIDSNRDRYNELHREYASRNRGKTKARNVLGYAVRSGKLKRGICSVCGDTAEAHHADYKKPLEVIWLCTKHHRVLEKALI